MNIDMSNTCPARSLLAMHVFVTGPSDYIQICLGRDISILKFIVHEKKISQRASVPCTLCSLSFSDSGLMKHFLLRSCTDLITYTSEPVDIFFVS